jgi:phosphatidylglycerophosphatase A
VTLQRLFLTFFGAGLSPKAPGTVGTLAALPVGVMLLYFMGMETLFMATLGITIIGVFEINKAEATSGIHDAGEIVIDEAAGIWIALMVSHGTAMQATFAYAPWVAVLLSFATFRLFDIWKPSTIGWIDRNVKGGLGVMGDDILAGFAGGFLTILLLTGIGQLL